MNWLLGANWDILVFLNHTRKTFWYYILIDLASGLLFSLTSNSVRMQFWKNLQWNQRQNIKVRSVLDFVNPEIRAEILFQIVTYWLKGEIVSPQIVSQNQTLQNSAKWLWHLRWHIVRFPTQVRWFNTNVCHDNVCQREGDLEAMRTLGQSTSVLTSNGCQQFLLLLVGLLAKYELFLDRQS